MKKLSKMLLTGVLLLIVGFLSFAGATVFSSLFFQTAVAEDDGMSPTTTTAEPAVNPAANSKYGYIEYGFTYLTYRVKRGDNLTDIARRHSSDMNVNKYKISVEEIQTLNGIKNPNRVLRGQKLLLPVYYAKEVRAEALAEIQSAIGIALASKEAALMKTKRTELALGALLVFTIAFLAYLIFLYIPDKIRAQKSTKTESNKEPIEPEKFLTHPDEIIALLKKCTGQEIADILESEFVEIPRGPGSAATNEVKVKNISELMKKYPELLSRLPVLWREHLATKMETSHIRIET